jgi:hypothetical protein
LFSIPTVFREMAKFVHFFLQKSRFFSPGFNHAPLRHYAGLRNFAFFAALRGLFFKFMESAVLPMPQAARISRSSSVPWYCVLAVLSATCIPVGALWDISWHSAIGRDTFWTPAHITIHIGGVVPGLIAGWLALRATWFGTAEDRAAAVRIGPFFAPLGAWVIIWGAMAMLFSAPFDDWWHNAYGLDVEILSPPHTVLAAGMYAVAIGSLLLVLSYQNRTGERNGGFLFTYATGVLLIMASIIITEKSHPNHQHGSFFYQIAASIYPMYLVAAARASKVRWGATIAAAVYMLIIAAMVWILPLFPARPMLAPIYNPVDHMVPPSFPLLMVIPAFAIDLILARSNGRPRTFWSDTGLAFLAGGAFLITFFVSQYYFSIFLISPASDNWFFAGNRWWPYFVKLSDFRFRFWNPTGDPLTISGMLIALALAVFKTRIGLAVGAWMSKVQR